MNQEFIFVQTDPAFNIVLKCLKELREEKRLQVTHYQMAELRDIESNDDSEDRNFMFGGEGVNPNHAFGRTASAIVRMCMLEAAGVPRRLWPALGRNAGRRNKGKLHNPLGQQPRGFCLATTARTARQYWRKYNQLYPHFRIEDEVDEVDLNTQISIPSMMLIFRGFTEVVEITTTFKATRREDQQFDSYIHVICIVRKISVPTEEGNDGRFTRQLKELMVPVEIQEEYFEDMTKVKEDEGLQKLNDAIDKWKFWDTNHGLLAY